MRERMTPSLELIGAAVGLGAQDQRCADGPDALLASGLSGFLNARGIDTVWREIVHEEPELRTHRLKAVTAFCAQLADRVLRSLGTHRFPVVLGGDHSCAIGTWSAVRESIQHKRAPLGLLWIDAHLDSHVPATSPSGAIHGMPLACLLGYGDPPLVNLLRPEAKLKPEHLCLVGIRSYEKGELDLLNRLGVRVIYMEEVRRRGLDAAIAEGLEIVTRGTAGFGLSIDLDAMDPLDAPGVGSPEPGGIRAPELLDALTLVAAHPKLCALEIAEYNPHLDHNGQTARFVGAIVEAVAAPQKISA